MPISNPQARLIIDSGRLGLTIKMYQVATQMGKVLYIAKAIKISAKI